jgi:hypothetical protein
VIENVKSRAGIHLKLRLLPNLQGLQSAVWHQHQWSKIANSHLKANESTTHISQSWMMKTVQVPGPHGDQSTVRVVVNVDERMMIVVPRKSAEIEMDGSKVRSETLLLVTLLCYCYIEVQFNLGNKKSINAHRSVDIQPTVDKKNYSRPGSNWRPWVY